MAEQKPKRAGTVVLENVRLSFPHLHEPSKSSDDGPLKFRATALMDPKTEIGKKNIAKLEAAIKEAAAGVWKEKADKIRKILEKDRRGLREGETGTNKQGDIYDGYEDMMFIGATNGRRPKVIDRDKSAIELEDIPTKLYAGCYVNMIVSVWATNLDKHGGNGIFATLELVQFRRDGEPFGAGQVDEDDFDELDMSDDEDEDGDDMI